MPVNTTLLSDVLASAGELDPPGSVVSIIGQPGGLREAIEVAAVIEHRMAFYFWLKWVAKRRRETQDQSAPDLLTIDWHDDVGCDDDYLPEQISQLNPDDPVELAVFAWAGLRAINDGHIAPALYLDAINDIHVVLKQHAGDESTTHEPRHCTMTDLHGRLHNIYSYRGKEIAEAVAAIDESQRRILLDIDLDYFTEYDGEDFLEPDEIRPISNARIRRFLRGPLIRAALPHLAGMTIALEPSYCGGMISSLRLLKILNAALFDGELFGEGDIQWRSAVVT
jgi:hypothetical protein